MIKGDEFFPPYEMLYGSMANERLKDHFVIHKDDLVEVKGWNVGYDKECLQWSVVGPLDKTHKTYLVKSSIEEIKPCEHELDRDFHVIHLRFRCSKCHKKLKPTGWQEVE